jgi:hypothetical protein
MPNSHSKYRTSGNAVDFGLLRMTSEGDHSGARVERSRSLAGQTFHLNAGCGEERLHGPGGSIGRNAGPDDLPLGGLKLDSGGPSARFDNLDHVNPVRQRRVEPPTDIVRLATAGHSEFEILRLAR